MNAIDAVAGRDPYGAGEVAVYKNLRNGRWSITAVKGDDNRGLLLGHADEVRLTGARMVVKESRRAAIAAGGHREVCAWIIGKLGEPIIGDRLRRVTFHPSERATFFLPDTGQEIHTAGAVAFDLQGNAWI
jgi:hypothetical protein